MGHLSNYGSYLMGAEHGAAEQRPLYDLSTFIYLLGKHLSTAGHLLVAVHVEVGQQPLHELQVVGCFAAHQALHRNVLQ
jgi:hypothetical protein